MRYNYDYQLRREIYELNRLRVDLAALRFMLKARRYYRQKANYNPSQPRVPRGFRGGGQWSGSGGYGEPSRSDRPAGRPPREAVGVPPSESIWKKPDSDDANGAKPILVSDEPRERKPTPIDIYFGPNSRPSSPTSTPEPIGEPPHIPKERPSRLRIRLRVTREVAQWLAGASSLASVDPKMIAIKIAIYAAEWLIEEYFPMSKHIWKIENRYQNCRRLHGTDALEEIFTTLWNRRQLGRRILEMT